MRQSLASSIDCDVHHRPQFDLTGFAERLHGCRAGSVCPLIATVSCRLHCLWPLPFCSRIRHGLSLVAQTRTCGRTAPRRRSKPLREGTRVLPGWEEFTANSVKPMRRGPEPEILGSPVQESNACIRARFRRHHVEHEVALANAICSQSKDGPTVLFSLPRWPP